MLKGKSSRLVLNCFSYNFLQDQVQSTRFWSKAYLSWNKVIHVLYKYLKLYNDNFFILNPLVTRRSITVET